MLVKSSLKFYCLGIKEMTEKKKKNSATLTTDKHRWGKGCVKLSLSKLNVSVEWGSESKALFKNLFLHTRAKFLDFNSPRETLLAPTYGGDRSFAPEPVCPCTNYRLNWMVPVRLH